MMLPPMIHAFLLRFPLFSFIFFCRRLFPLLRSTFFFFFFPSSSSSSYSSSSSISSSSSSSSSGWGLGVAADALPGSRRRHRAQTLLHLKAVRLLAGVRIYFSFHSSVNHLSPFFNITATLYYDCKKKYSILFYFKKN